MEYEMPNKQRQEQDSQITSLVADKKCIW